VVGCREPYILDALRPLLSFDGKCASAWALGHVGERVAEVAWSFGWLFTVARKANKAAVIFLQKSLADERAGH